MQYTSYHPQSIFKAFIMGECIRYVRTNTLKNNYILKVQRFKQRLVKRRYPSKFTEKCNSLVSYNHRHRYLICRIQFDHNQLYPHDLNF